MIKKKTMTRKKSTKKLGGTLNRNSVVFANSVNAKDEQSSSSNTSKPTHLPEHSEITSSDPDDKVKSLEEEVQHLKSQVKKLTNKKKKYEKREKEMKQIILSLLPIIDNIKKDIGVEITSDLAISKTEETDSTSNNPNN